MSWPGRKKLTPIGLDLGGRLMKAVQLVGRPGAWSLAAAALVPRPNPAAELSPDDVRLIRDVLKRQGFSGTTIVAAIPGQKLLNGILELPPRSSGAPIDDIARNELAAMHRLDAQQLEIECWDLPAGSRGRGGTRVMATGCLTADAEAVLDLLEAQDLDVAALDTHAAALARFCHSEQDQQITALLDLGWSSALLVLMCSGAVIYERRMTEAGLSRLYQTLVEAMEVEPEIADCLLRRVGLEFGGEDFDPAVVEDLHAAIRDHFQDFARELSVSFSYASHQYPELTVDRLVLMGGGAAIPGLAEWLQEQTDLGVQTLCPRDRFACPGMHADFGAFAGLSAAAGLALHDGGRPA